eukprot:gene12542-8594_t
MTDVVKVTLTHSISRSEIPEKRYALRQTIQGIKQNLVSYFGTPVEHMRLELYDNRGVQLSSSMEDEKMLGYYQCRDDFRIHCVDLQPAAQVDNYEDVSQVEKFEISEQEWLQREDNARAFKERMLAAQAKSREEAGLPSASSAPPHADADAFKEEASAIQVGDRCQCQPGDRLGTVRYVGRLAALKPGFWVGVEFDEPVGKSDGTIKGERVFDCRPQYAGFLRPHQVEVGDFPPEEF